MTRSLHWQTTRLRTCFVTSSKRRFVEAEKQKPSRKTHSKLLHQAIDPFLASKVLASSEVKNLSLPPAKNLPLLQDLPQVHPLMRSLLLKDFQCRYPLTETLKYFRENWEKLSSDQAALNMISGYKRRVLIIF